MDVPTDRTSAALLALLAQTVTHTQRRAPATAVTPDLSVQNPLSFSMDGASLAQFIQPRRTVRITKFFYQEHLL